MTKKKFIKRYLKRTSRKLNLIEFNTYYKVMVCNCEEYKSEHFAAISNDKYLIKDHNQFNRFKNK